MYVPEKQNKQETVYISKTCSIPDTGERKKSLIKPEYRMVIQRKVLHTGRLRPRMIFQMDLRYGGETDDSEFGGSTTIQVTEHSILRPPQMVYDWCV